MTNSGNTETVMVVSILGITLAVLWAISLELGYRKIDRQRLVDVILLAQACTTGQAAAIFKFSTDAIERFIPRCFIVSYDGAGNCELQLPEYSGCDTAIGRFVAEWANSGKKYATGTWGTLRIYKLPIYHADDLGTVVNDLMEPEIFLRRATIKFKMLGLLDRQKFLREFKKLMFSASSS